MPKPVKFKLFIEYNGTKFSGWQKQRSERTVQGTLIDTIKNIFSATKGESNYIDLQGSGRTDRGVHAYEQVAHLECITMLGPEILKMKLNDELPSDINILEIEQADKKFHARHSAKSRQYIYRISKRRTAFEKRYVWWIKDKLDVTKMKQAIELFEGMHDYSSFADKSEEDTSTKVLVENISVEEKGDFIFISIRASHFLWKMVRRIVGVLVEVGRGKIKPKEIELFFKNHSSRPASLTAPPSGLFLEKVFY